MRAMRETEAGHYNRANTGFLAEVTSVLGDEGRAGKRDGAGRCSWQGQGHEGVSLSQDLARPGLWPYLVGRHQIKVTGVRWVKLHDMVHRLPVGHCHQPPAHHLHVLIQVDLWGWGCAVGAQGRWRPNSWGGLTQVVGLSTPSSLQPFQDWWEFTDMEGRAVGPVSALWPRLCPLQELPPD